MINYKNGNEKIAIYEERISERAAKNRIKKLFLRGWNCWSSMNQSHTKATKGVVDNFKMVDFYWCRNISGNDGVIVITTKYAENT